MCGEERAVRLDGKIGVVQNLQALLCVLFCPGDGSVVPGHPGARRLGDTRRVGGVCTLDELDDCVNGEEADLATSTLDLVDGWSGW